MSGSPSPGLRQSHCQPRHSRTSGNPESLKIMDCWIPTFVGMTLGELLHVSMAYAQLCRGLGPESGLLDYEHPEDYNRLPVSGT